MLCVYVRYNINIYEICQRHIDSERRDDTIYYCYALCPNCFLVGPIQNRPRTYVPHSCVVREIALTQQLDNIVGRYS